MKMMNNFREQRRLIDPPSLIYIEKELWKERSREVGESYG